MTAAGMRTSRRQVSADLRRGHGRTGSDAGAEIWSSLLDRVSATKQFPTKQILLLGGSPASQRAFISTLSAERTVGAAAAAAAGGLVDLAQPVANELAVGYTYVDVLDPDNDDDMIARVAVHTLSKPDPAFVRLIRPVLQPKTVAGMLIVVLLDWHHPWLWLRQLRDWIRLLRGLIVDLDEDAKAVLEENVNAWRDRRQSVGLDPGPASDVSTGHATPVGGGPVVGSSLLSTDSSTGAPTSTISDLKLPLGPGELDSPLGLPLCVVAQHADRIEHLEKTRGWQDDQFDFILQIIRTVLLKHGAGLVYSMPSARSAAPVRDTVLSMLDIRSSVRARLQIKHNVIDRDQVLVPPDWDSWGKIRVLREGFEVERVSRSWESDIEPAWSRSGSLHDGVEGQDEAEDSNSVVRLYEAVIRPPSDTGVMGLSSGSTSRPGLDVEPVDNQVFLQAQLKVLHQLQAEDDKNRQAGKTVGGSTSSTGRASLPANFGVPTSGGAAAGPAAAGPAPGSTAATGSNGSTGAATTGSSAAGANRPDRANIVEDQIGPVQFNMGGIQVDADDVLRKLREREESRVTDEAAAAAAVVSGVSPTMLTVSTVPTGQSTISTPTNPATGPASGAGSTTGTADKTNDQLSSFFSGLSRKKTTPGPSR